MRGMRRVDVEKALEILKPREARWISSRPPAGTLALSAEHLPRGRDAWMLERPFAGSFWKGVEARRAGESFCAPYTNRGWGHQHIKAWEFGWRVGLQAGTFK